jgi:ATP-binding protein involved in chromosome partitioning
MSPVTPVELLQVSPTLLGVIWNDGHHSMFNVRKLRMACPCAGCVDEWTREKILKDENVPADVRPRKMETVGRYALKISWSDGHDTGFYTFENLRAQCECPKCKKA